MEEFLDILWLKIVVGVQFSKHILDVIFGPLNALGPAVAIATIASRWVTGVRGAASLWGGKPAGTK